MNILELLKPIRAFVFDMDGVLTDCTILVYESGEQVRKMHIRDGYALQLAIKQGYHVLVISGANSEGVRIRLEKLGITEVYMDIKDKKAHLTQYMISHQLSREEVLYMGDDIPDYEVMQMAGVSCAPSDAAGSIRQIADYISPNKGGEGCVRDVVEKVLLLNDNWLLETGVPSR
jgi:3-deoxy-D-manno-octulosonate 8-phosphate phosphatase (KDO 8-P phosphatase)